MNKTNMPLIETRNLKKYFKVSKSSFLHAVDNVNLSIQEGMTLGVVGESGCGKSTLGRTMLRLLEPTAGEVIFEGQNITELSQAEMRKMRKKMQIIFQDPYSSINPRMTVADIIAQPMIVNKTYSNRQELYTQVSNLMDIVGLASRLCDVYPHELDGGRRQRIGVARALSLKPKFIVCDEPVSALDVSIQAQILNLLMDLQEEMGLTYLFITHDLSVVKHISDEIAVMYLGQCVERCSSNELFRSPLHPYTKMLLAAILVPKLSARRSALEVIHGEVTNPIDPKPSCRFAARCSYATEACTKANPELNEISQGHYVACFHTNE